MGHALELFPFFQGPRRPTGRRLPMIVAGLLGMLIALCNAATAQDSAAKDDAAQDRQATAATTTADPSIPIERLRLMLRPLMKKSLETEAKAWLKLLQGKVQEITDVEIQRDQLSEQGADETAEQQAEIEVLRKRLVELRTDLAGLSTRVQVVLDQLSAKGGNIEEQEKYVKAVTGMQSTTADVKSLWAIFVRWLQSPEGGRQWVWRLVTFSVVLLVSWILSRFVGRATGKLIDRYRGISNLLKDFAKKIAGRTVLLIGLLVGLSAVGMEVAPMLTAVGAGGFILAFALQETLSNFASGAMIMVYRPFDISDYVTVAGVSGTVQRLSLVSTTLLTPDHKVLVVPNNKIWGDTITNVTGSPTRRVDLVFGIGYDDDINKALHVLTELATQHELTLETPEPTITVDELADSSVNLLCRPWVKTSDYWTVYRDLTRQVKDRFDAEGISIPFPQRDVHVYQSTPATD